MWNLTGIVLVLIAWKLEKHPAVDEVQSQHFNIILNFDLT